MKNKKLLNLLLVVFLSFGLVACGEATTASTNPPSSGTTSSEVTTKSQDETTKSSESTTLSTEEKNKDEVDYSEAEHTAEGVKLCAKNQTQELYTLNASEDSSLEVVLTYVLNAIEKAEGTVEELKVKLNAYYKELCDVIELFKATYNTVKTYVEHQKEVLLSLHESLSKVVNDANKYYLQAKYEEVVALLESVKSQANLANVKAQVETKIAEYKAMAVNYAKNVINETIATAINQAIVVLDDVHDKAFSATKDQQVKTMIEELYVASKLTITSCMDESKVKEEVTDILESFKAHLYDYVKDQVEYAVEELKKIALSKLDEAKTELLSKIKDEDLRDDIDSFYTTEVGKINAVTTKVEAKAVIEEIKNDAIEFAEAEVLKYLNKLKASLIGELDTKITEGIAKIDDQDLKGSVNDFYDEQKTIISGITSLEDFEEQKDTLKKNTLDFLEDVIKNQLIALVNLCQTKVDNAITALLEKIDDQDIKTELNGYYDELKTDLNNAKSAEDVKAAVSAIETKLSNYSTVVLTKYFNKLKTTVINGIDEVASVVTPKLPTQTLKNELTTYITGVKADINDLTIESDFKAALKDVVKDAELFGRKLVAKSLETARAAMKALIAEMTDDTKFANVLTFIPDTMTKGYANSTVTASDVTYDFTNFVNVSDILYGGFGKGWHRMINNIDTVEDFVSAVDKVSPAITTSISLINAYLESEYADSLSFNTESESGFSVSVSYDETTKMLEYSISFTGEQSVSEISISYNKDSKVKEVFVGISENKQMKYKTTATSFEFGATVGGFYYYMSIENDDIVSGKTYLSIPLFGGYAEFYIDDNYVTIVADKGEGVNTLNSYNCEVYDKSTGKLLGFENRGADVAATRNRLWFNLCDISGITSIKMADNKIYLNGSSTEYKIATAGIIGARNIYKIETYKQYFYEFDNATQKIIEYEVEVPMMFIQEEDYDDFEKSFQNKNSFAASVSLSSVHLNKIMNEYDAKVDAVITNKAAFTDEFVEEFLNN